ncbi:MAG: SigE family RNA polymerase sigma factor [Acidimicrobiales bacterium]|jgi:RNA polymerase sigma-70 factor (sigma-E family)
MRPSRQGHAGREEFERFVADNADALLRTAYLVVWDLAGAEDLVQECLFRVARRWPRVRSMDHPAAYARRVLVNLALDNAIRRARHRSELDLSSRGPLEDRHDESAARALGMVESSSELLDAIGELPGRQRVTLVLRYFEDLTEAQVAETMGCSVGTVKSTTSRALERLRQTVVRSPAEDFDHALQAICDTKGAPPHDPGI